MDFQKKDWQFRDIISENELNRMEDGIEEGITKAEQAQDTADNAQNAIDNHIAATTGVHGATSAATPNTLVQRDSSGRAKFAAPVASDDVARKAETDAAMAAAQAAQSTADAALPKSGGTMTGPLVNSVTLAGANKTIQTWQATDGKTYQLVLRVDGSVSIYNVTDGVTVIKFGPGNGEVVQGNDYKFWHEGNDGPGSGLDADMVDGKHASAFVEKSGAKAFVSGAWAGLQADASETTRPEVDLFIAGVRHGLLTAYPNHVTLRRYNPADGSVPAELRLFDDGRAQINNNDLWHEGNNPKSLGVNGYQKLASGLIIQWGVVSLANPDAEVSVTLPIAFPNRFGAVMTNVLTTATGGYSANTFDYTLSSFKLRHNSPAATDVRWFAIGY